MFAMLLAADQIGYFLGASVLLTLSPGPDSLATLSIGLSRGWRPAVGFGVGCGLGCLFHTAFAVLGISAAIRSSPTAFIVLKWCGTAYLTWLAFGALRSRGSGIQEFQGQEKSGWRYLGKGLLANAINPKVAIFFLSFLPGFVTVAHGQPELQMAVLGLIFTAVATVVFAMLGYFSGRIGKVLQSLPQLSVWLDRMTGVLFLLLALRLAWPESWITS